MPGAGGVFAIRAPDRSPSGARTGVRKPGKQRPGPGRRLFCVLALLALGGCDTEVPPEDLAVMEVMGAEAVQLEASLPSYRGLVQSAEYANLRTRWHLDDRNPAVDEEDLAHIMCASQAGLVKHGGVLEDGLGRVHEGLDKLDHAPEGSMAAVTDITEEAEALLRRMNAVQQEAGELAAELSGEECTGEETLQEELPEEPPERRRI